MLALIYRFEEQNLVTKASIKSSLNKRIVHRVNGINPESKKSYNLFNGARLMMLHWLIERERQGQFHQWSSIDSKIESK